MRYLLLLILLSPIDLPSEEFIPNQEELATHQPSLVQKIVVIAAFALLPFFIMLFTSFLKMVVVLSLLRQAVGVQNAPPNQVLNGIGLIMAIYVMAPTILAMYNESQDYLHNDAPPSEESVFSAVSANYMINIIEKGKEPFKDFLQRNTSEKHITYFHKLAKRQFPDPYKSNLKAEDLIVLLPSFVTSQVKGAFEIGVLIYLPFFVIDLVVSNILLAMGMMMLSPLTIALPLKLLLLVMIDGWTLIVEGIVYTYK